MQISLTDNTFDNLSEVIDVIVHRVLKDVDVEVRDISLVEDGINEYKFVITLLYADQEENLTGSKLNELTYQARKKLVELGEVRYPFFKHSFPDNALLGA